MKRQIRRKVFETNSSSMHSLTVEKKGITEYLHVDEDENKVIVNFGEFGWGYETYNDAETKLSYLITMLAQYNSFSAEELYDTDEFRRINNIVASRCECDGIIIDDSYDGYVDHQSVERIGSLMSEYDCTIEEFIFDSGITLIIDNDNH